MSLNTKKSKAKYKELIMAPKTKAEIEAENKNLRVQLAETKKLIEKILASQPGVTIEDKPKEVRREDNPGEGGGWVIKTPDQTRFDKKTGKTKQVFYSGTTVGIRFVNNYGFVYTSRKGADLIVHRLEHDFGYTVNALGEEAMGEFRNKFDSMQPEEDKTGMEKLSQPQAFG